MAIPVLMPRQGETVESCLILKWKKKEGDKVDAHESICEVETNKAVFEVEAPEKGIILKIFYKEGDDVPVLSIIALIGQPGEDISSFMPEKTLTTEIKEETENVKMKEAITPSKEKSFASGVVSISPRARRLAKREGVDISKVSKGSGPSGRITERDIRNTLSKFPKVISATQTSTKETFPGPVREISVQGVRKVIAENMLKSLQTTAQLTLNSSANVSNLLSYRKKLKVSSPERGLQEITINDIIMYITVKTLLKFKALNAYFLDNKILEFERVHLAFAVDAPQGLVVPVIRNANLLSLKEISKESKRLSSACLQGTIKPDELTGGTFTITNLGPLGIESFTPILNLPQVAVLGVCNIQLKAIREEYEVKLAPHLGLSLTFDHRGVDGAPAAKFLKELSLAIVNFKEII